MGHLGLAIPTVTVTSPTVARETGRGPKDQEVSSNARCLQGRR